MKTRMIVAVVVAIHGVAVGTLLMQGCRTDSQVMAPQDALPPVEPMIAEEEYVPSVDMMDTVEPMPMPQIETTAYVIRKGDTLSAIAKHYGIKVGDIMALNGIDNPNKLQIGQKIDLPGIHDVSSQPPVKAGKKSSEAATAKESAAVPAGDGKTYTIQKGDSLSTIAKKLGVSVKALREANNLSSDFIVAGKTLVIPGDAAAPTVAMVDADATTPDLGPGPSPVAPDVDAGVAPVGLTAAPSVDGGGTADGTAPERAPAPISADTKEHTVTAGEDLSTIAIQWGVTEDSIKQLNGLTSDALTDGQKLLIPAH